MYNTDPLLKLLIEKAKSDSLREKFAAYDLIKTIIDLETELNKFSKEAQINIINSVLVKYGIDLTNFLDSQIINNLNRYRTINQTYFLPYKIDKYIQRFIEKSAQQPEATKPSPVESIQQSKLLDEIIKQLKTPTIQQTKPVQKPEPKKPTEQPKHVPGAAQGDQAFRPPDKFRQDVDEILKQLFRPDGVGTAPGGSHTTTGGPQPGPPNESIIERVPGYDVIPSQPGPAFLTFLRTAFGIGPYTNPNYGYGIKDEEGKIREEIRPHEQYKGILIPFSHEEPSEESPNSPGPAGFWDFLLRLTPHISRAALIPKLGFGMDWLTSLITAFSDLFEYSSRASDIDEVWYNYWKRLLGGYIFGFQRAYQYLSDNFSVGTPRGLLALASLILSYETGGRYLMTSLAYTLFTLLKMPAALIDLAVTRFKDYKWPSLSSGIDKARRVVVSVLGNINLLGLSRLWHKAVSEHAWANLPGYAKPLLRFVPFLSPMWSSVSRTTLQGIANLSGVGEPHNQILEHFATLIKTDAEFVSVAKGRVEQESINILNRYERGEIKTNPIESLIVADKALTNNHAFWTEDTKGFLGRADHLFRQYVYTVTHDVGLAREFIHYQMKALADEALRRLRAETRRYELTEIQGTGDQVYGIGIFENNRRPKDGKLPIGSAVFKATEKGPDSIVELSEASNKLKFIYEGIGEKILELIIPKSWQEALKSQSLSQSLKAEVKSLEPHLEPKRIKSDVVEPKIELDGQKIREKLLDLASKAWQEGREGPVTLTEAVTSLILGEIVDRFGKLVQPAAPQTTNQTTTQSGAATAQPTTTQTTTQSGATPAQPTTTPPSSGSHQLSQQEKETLEKLIMDQIGPKNQDAHKQGVEDIKRAIHEQLGAEIEIRPGERSQRQIMLKERGEQVERLLNEYYVSNSPKEKVEGSDKTRKPVTEVTKKVWEDALRQKRLRQVSDLYLKWKKGK